MNLQPRADIWIEKTNEEGRKYYFNKKTKKI